AWAGRWAGRTRTYAPGPTLPTLAFSKSAVLQGTLGVTRTPREAAPDPKRQARHVRPAHSVRLHHKEFIARPEELDDRVTSPRPVRLLPCGLPFATTPSRTGYNAEMLSWRRSRWMIAGTQ